MLSQYYPLLHNLWASLVGQKAKGNFTIQVYWKIGALLQETTRTLAPAATKKLYYAFALKLKDAFPDQPIGATKLRQFHHFYLAFPNWQSTETALSWSHYGLLIREKDHQKREFYYQAALRYQWSTTTLTRQIKALYYERHCLWSTTQESEKTTDLPIKDHYILEFLQLSETTHLLERELETALLEKLQHFLLELGNGFSFVARQQCVTTTTGKQFFIDLVFYHFALKCFVLIDLKVGELTHRDIGQMDMYVRLYEEKWRGPNDNPTIGIILCSEKDQTLVKYSLLSDTRQVFASTYQLSLR